MKKQTLKIDWTQRLKNADKTFDKWYSKFKIDQGIRYFEGFQWDKFVGFADTYSPYTVNLVYSTIRIKRASLLFDNPTFIIKPAPEEDAPGFDPISSSSRANLKTIALNSWVKNKKNHFLMEAKMAAEDAFFGFGLIEVGYSANIIDNPNAQKPLYDDSLDQDDSHSQITPKELPDAERIFVKRINFKQFRVGGRDAYILEHANWCGYYDFYDFRDAKEAWPKAYSDKSRFAGYRSVDGDPSIITNIADDSDEEKKRLLDSGNLVKIWKCWDFRAMKIFWWDESNSIELDSEDFENTFLYPLIFDHARTGFLPIPPVFNWLSPQDEVNESSEQLRVHRRRASRHYLFDKSRLEEEELQKVVNGPDGTLAGIDGPVDPTIINIVPLAPLDASVQAAFLQSKDNFNIVTLSGSEQRGQVDRETATAAAIKNQNSQQAEAEPKTIVAEWLNDIARGILLNLARVTNPFWVQHQAPPDEHLGGNIQTNAQAQFKQISGEDIEGEDFETSIEISSISPIDNQAELQKFLQLISILNQFQEISISPMLVRETAKKVGYFNENIIAELQQMAQMRMVSMMQQASLQNSQSGTQGQGSISPNSPHAQKMNAVQTPPQQEQIRNQLQNQLLPTGS